VIALRRIIQPLNRIAAEHPDAVALLLVAFAPPMISLSAQARGYTLAFLAICACLYFQERVPAQAVNATPVLSRSARTRQPRSRQVVSGSRAQPRNSL
jgi:hypothetical protein